jgi:hypothetical protein
MPIRTATVVRQEYSFEKSSYNGVGKAAVMTLAGLVSIHGRKSGERSTNGVASGPRQESAS